MTQLEGHAGNGTAGCGHGGRTHLEGHTGNGTAGGVHREWHSWRGRQGTAQLDMHMGAGHSWMCTQGVAAGQHGGGRQAQLSRHSVALGGPRDRSPWAAPMCPFPACPQQGWGHCREAGLGPPHRYLPPAQPWHLPLRTGKSWPNLAGFN